MNAEETARKWFDYAEMDWQTAKHLYDSFYPKPREIICFHCQQAIEKFLKGIFVLYDKSFLRTHDLAVLVDSLPDEVEMPENFKKICAGLTVFSVETRYPSELGIEEHRMDVTVKDTACVYEWLRDYVERIFVKEKEEITSISE